jgi:hypothetical protein
MLELIMGNPGSEPRALVLLRSREILVASGPPAAPVGLGGYGVNAAFMSFIRRGCHIHAV